MPRFVVMKTIALGILAAGLPWIKTVSIDGTQTRTRDITAIVVYSPVIPAGVILGLNTGLIELIYSKENRLNFNSSVKRATDESIYKISESD